MLNRKTLDPLLMDFLGNFLDNSTETLVNISSKSHNPFEILDEVIKDFEAPKQLKTALLGSPDPDISNLSLEDLVSIDANVNDSDSNNEGFSNSSDKEENKNKINLNIVSALNTIVQDKSYIPEDNLKKQLLPTLDFVIDSNNEVSSYIDWMQPLSTSSVNNCNVPAIKTSADAEDQTFSKYIDDLIVDYKVKDIYSPPKKLHNAKVSNESLEYLTTVECKHDNQVNNSQCSLISDSVSSNIPSELFLKETRIKRPLDKSIYEIEKESTKRGKPSQEWKVIDHMIMNTDLDKDTIKKIKNNKSSRVHRIKNKEKFNDLFKRKIDLEKSNAELQMKFEVMQREVDLLKTLLVTKLSNSSK